MSVAETQCIYCGRTVGRQRKGEHAVPAALGEFAGFPTLAGRVCTKCNGEISRLEAQFCRYGPVGVYRTMLGIEGRRQHRKVNPFTEGGYGSAPIDAPTYNHPACPGIPVLVEFEKGSTIRELTQIVVPGQDGQYHAIRLDKSIVTREDLDARLLSHGIARVSGRIWVFGDPEDRPRIAALASGMGAELANWGPQEPFEVPSVQTFHHLTDYYPRALAKIAFHYLLTVDGRVRGDEDAFEAIRGFIMKGQVRDPVKVGQEALPSILLLPPRWRLTRFTHVLQVVWSSGRVAARLHFFFGPENQLPVYRVEMAEEVPQFSGSGSVEQVFAYYPEGRMGRFSGEVLPAGATLRVRFQEDG